MASFDYMGVFGREPAEVLRALGFSEGKPTRYPDTRGNSAGRMRSGWFLLFGHSVWTKHAQELSAGCQAIYVEASDTAMCSRAIFYEDGRTVWSVAHDDDPGEPFDVRTEGTLPAEYAALHAELMEKQRRSVEENEKVDYLYDLPLRVAGVVTGYVPLENEPENAFFELEKVEPAPPAPASTPPAPVSPPERPWWRFW
ncbi:hypothetical protein [Longimicrobium sp.]|uniref:hypothetical protein n=1 Tax=Longimicrobium sp. TaxID=2029185 RepID=UPI002E37CFE1|nr:hypothetical protein [Longimicrobium sp.]HEX6039161.1 hypothetical protein [Longimicrobium sp.]